MLKNTFQEPKNRAIAIEKARFFARLKRPFLALVPALAWWKFWSFSKHISISALKGHAFVCGGSGTGKSEVLKFMILRHIRNRKRHEAIIVFDPHSKLVEEIADCKMLKKQEGCVVRLDPFLSNELHFSINPLEPIGAERWELELQAQELISVLEAIINSKKLSVNMSAVIFPAIMALIQRPNSTLKDLRDLLSVEEESALAQNVMKYARGDEYIFLKDSFFETKYAPTRKALHARLSELLQSEKFAQVLCQPSTVSWRKIVKPRAVILVDLRKAQLQAKVSSAMGRFLCASLTSFIMRRSQQKFITPVFLYVDEFQNFISTSMETILTEARKFGLHAIFCQQLLGQGMSASFERVVMGNTAIKIIGNNEAYTVQKLSKALNLDPDRVRQLRTGVFLAGFRGFRSFTVKAPKNIIGRNGCVSNKKSESRKQEQLELYYQPFVRHAPSAIPIHRPEPKSALPSLALDPPVMLSANRSELLSVAPR